MKKMLTREQKETLGIKDNSQSFLRDFLKQSPNSTEYVAAFEKNCPQVRMTDEERQELKRLFYVSQTALRNLLYATEDWELLSPASKTAFQNQARKALNTEQQ